MYLAPPPTSVPSERLFSVAGDIISKHRTRLNPDNAEKLIFMQQSTWLRTRVAPDIISGPGPGRNPAVFFKSGQIRPRPDMTTGFEAGFIKF